MDYTQVDDLRDYQHEWGLVDAQIRERLAAGDTADECREALEADLRERRVSDAARVSAFHVNEAVSYLALDKAQRAFRPGELETGRPSAYAVARLFREANPGRVQAGQAGGRVRWWIRSSRSGILTPMYTPRGVHDLLWRFVNADENMQQMPAVDARTVNEAVDILAAMCPLRPDYAESQGIDVTRLLAWEDVEPKWVVQDLLSPGLTLLAGAPKARKSWMCAALAVDRLWLDRYNNAAEKVLWIALEDTDRRMADRLKNKMKVTKLSRQVTLHTSWPGAAEGGIDRLDAMVKSERYDLVIIDTIGRLRGAMGSDGYNYQADVQVLAPLKEIADRYGTCILGVAHTRKGEDANGDWMNNISGTTGMPGTADTNMVLEKRRGDHGGVLRAAGRDVAEQDIDIEFSEDDFRWHKVVDPIETIKRVVCRPLWSGTRSKVELETGLPKTTCERYLKKLVDDGTLTATEPKAGRATKYAYANADLT